MNKVLSVSFRIAFATPKSITFGNRFSVVERDQHVGRLHVAVDDPLMSVLDRLTHGMHSSSRCSSVSFCSSQNLVIATPLISSMTK